MRLSLLLFVAAAVGVCPLKAADKSKAEGQSLIQKMGSTPPSWARAAFWWQKAGETDKIELAHCYFKLGSKAMAVEILEHYSTDYTRNCSVARLWSEIGESEKALAIALEPARQTPDVGFLATGDICRTAGRTAEALQDDLQADENGGSEIGRARFETPRMWQYSARLIAPEPRGHNTSRAQKDPSVVFYNDGWHVFTIGAAGASVVHHIQIAAPSAKSQVPEITFQGRFLAPQAISTVDISADGKFITVGTMAFSHDANVWQFAPDGTILAKRHFPPWAPMQAITLSGGRTLAVGLAYSRVTSPEPTVWLGRAEELWTAKLTDDLAEADSRDGQFARLRPGEDDWRAGWLASSLGELFVRGPDWIFKPPSRFLDADARRHRLRHEVKDLLPTTRAMRMASSRDGKRVGFGWLSFARNVPGLTFQTEALSVWQVNQNQRLWSAAPSITNAPTALPDPIKDFAELAKDFRLSADDLVPGRVVSSVALNGDGSRVAIVEYGIWGWVRNAPAIGKWDPPIHVLNFLPRQRGRLRVFDREGREIHRDWLPEDGTFEVGFGSADNVIWCWPAAWFARGMAGAVWLPIDSPGRTVHRIGIENQSTLAFAFPDAVADCSLSPATGQAIISCWDGWIYLLERTGAVSAKWNAGGPARLAWSSDGSFAVAGTSQGVLLRLEKNGVQAWSKAIPVTGVPPSSRPPPEVVAGLPIFQGGRIPQSEHAYVGDIWIIRRGRKAVLIDAGGLSGFSITQQRLRELGVDEVTHVLHTHSHGDHAGGAYLWRAAGAHMVGPKSAALTLSWLMPMLTDYGIYPPRPLDVALPLVNMGDETEFEVSGLKFRALFVPGHSFDATIYKIELEGKRIAFTGDLGFENQDILHRCWGDAEKARALMPVIRNKLLAWRPDIVFTGHGVRTNGMEFIELLLRRTEESLR